MPARNPRPSFRRGSAMVMGIIIAVIVTGLIITIAWAAGVMAQSTGNLAKIDAAFYAAESGAQRVAWYCKNGQMSSITSPISGTVNGYAYSTTWSTVSGNTIKVTSTGSLGAVSYTLSEQVTPPAPPIATFSSAGNFDNKNLTINGTVWTGGSYTNGGSGSLNGNLIYGTTDSNIGSVTGTITQGSFTPIDFTQLNTTLLASAAAKSAGSGVIYDFTTVGGTNKVIYVNGDVTDPIIIGSGTLYVNGTITFTQPNQVVGSAAVPVNIVATGDIDFQKKSTINGSLYSKGNWNRAQVNLTGVVYVGGISPSNNGSSTLTLGAAPWFDPRAPGGSGGGSSYTTFTAFAGPMP